ncbi:MAG TPA: hypothetical protein VGI46_00610 [Candidatus Acidoferrum sp.]|jgi:hypothetical protein
MRVYYRAIPKTTIAPVNRYVREYQDAFIWVYDIKEATEDYQSSCETTQEKLLKEHGIETELVEVQDDKLMQPRYVLARDVDFDRIKSQSIEPGKGITTNTDEILTNPKPGETTFEGIHEVLDRDEDEPEDKDRK